MRCKEITEQIEVGKEAKSIKAKVATEGTEQATGISPASTRDLAAKHGVHKGHHSGCTEAGEGPGTETLERVAKVSALV